MDALQAVLDGQLPELNRWVEELQWFSRENHRRCMKDY